MKKKYRILLIVACVVAAAVAGYILFHQFCSPDHWAWHIHQGMDRQDVVDTMGREPDFEHALGPYIVYELTNGKTLVIRMNTVEFQPDQKFLPYLKDTQVVCRQMIDTRDGSAWAYHRNTEDFLFIYRYPILILILSALGVGVFFLVKLLRKKPQFIPYVIAFILILALIIFLDFAVFDRILTKDLLSVLIYKGMDLDIVDAILGEWEPGPIMSRASTRRYALPFGRTIEIWHLDKGLVTNVVDSDAGYPMRGTLLAMTILAVAILNVAAYFVIKHLREKRKQQIQA